ncbi:hypothetical protein FOZ63_019214, partial [Perkinsus olseni]
GSDSENEDGGENKQDENIETKGGEKQSETDVVAAEDQEGEADEKNGSINEESGDEDDEAFEASLAKAKEDQGKYMIDSTRETP